MSPVDGVARQLAMLLRITDLAARLLPREADDSPTGALLLLVRRAADADRASLFEIENAESDGDAPLVVTRLARDVRDPDGVVAETPFHPRHAALLLSPLASGTLEALGPFEDGDEDFYAHHHHEEPTRTKHAVLAPILVNGRPRGVLELARSDDRPFTATDLSAVEAGARAISATVWGMRREATIQAFLAALLPSVLDPSRATTSLPERVRAWLSAERLEPVERRALSLVATIAELAESSPGSIEMVQTMLSAARKAFARDVEAWSEVSRGR